ncbi:MAG TPA: ABC transporter permease [Candidatus Kryptonia bacterium]|nr:ABC transporter permease [Candidatus Kryptonia bacterium]
MTRSRHSFWSNIAAVAYKEASVIRHDRALLATVFAQPVMMLLLFGYALSNKPANVPWLVLDQSRTALSRRLIQDVRATGYFLAPHAVASYDEGRALLQRGDAVAFVVIPSSFRRDAERSRPQIQVLLDGSDPLTAARVGGYIGQVAATFDVQQMAPSEHRPEAHVRSPGLIDLRQRFWFNPTLADSKFFLAALAGMLLTNLCLSATSGGLVAERESGTYEQMLALPTTPIEIVLGKLVPYVGLSYGVMLFATLGAGVIFGVWPEGSWLTLLIVTLPFVLASLAIGVLVSTLAHTSAQAVFITVFFILPSFVLSGSMYPYQLMPHGIREFGGLFPLRWYQIALRRIVERGAGLLDVAGPILALVGLFALILSIIRWRMQPRLG